MARRRRRRLRAQPLIHQVPNIFTVVSIGCGLTAIRYGLDQRFELAVVLIILAGVSDGLDGRSARLLKITSNLGAQLDSLADFLSFGVAPAMLVYLWSLHQVKGVGWALVLLFVICSALRLARFNSELEEPAQPPWKTKFFTGMPAPAAAGVMIMPMLLSFALAEPWPRVWWLNASVAVVVALMMVSRLPTFSIKMIFVRVEPEWILPMLVCVGIIVAALLHAPWWTLFTVGVIYLISMPIALLAAWRLRRAYEPGTTAEASDAPASVGEPPHVVSIGSAGEDDQQAKAGRP